MKIIHIVWGLTTGGIETMLVNLVNQQVKDHDVSILVVNDLINKNLIDSIDKRVHMIYINRKIGSKNPIPILKMNYIVLKGRYDVIHAHDLVIYYFFLVRKSRICITIHRLITFKILSGYKKYFSISDSVKKNLLNIGIESTLINNGVEFDDFKSKKIEINPSPFKIVQLGRLSHQIKGQDLLLQAISLIEQKGNIITPISITFMGVGDSMSYLKKMIVDLHINSSITFLGDCTSTYVKNHLCDYDLLVQPSRVEGFGLSVIEGIAAGLPVLVAENDGPAGIIENGKYGFMHKNGDYIDLADKLQYIIMHYSELQGFVDETIDHMKNVYSIEQTAKKYLENY